MADMVIAMGGLEEACKKQFGDKWDDEMLGGGMRNPFKDLDADKVKFDIDGDKATANMEGKMNKLNMVRKDGAWLIATELLLAGLFKPAHRNDHVGHALDKRLLLGRRVKAFDEPRLVAFLQAGAHLL